MMSGVVKCALVAAMFSMGIGSVQAYDRVTIAQLRAIEEEFGRKLKIEYRNAENHLPKEWRRAAISARLTPISESELRRFPALLREALSRYPKEVITRNLRKIVLSDSISFYGLEYGATYSSDTVFLSSKGRDLGYTDRYLIEGFHHEFSSILFKNYRFAEKNWGYLNPKGFEYSGSGVHALKKLETSSLEGNAELYRKGFLAPYAVSALEEDFNVYSGIALSQPQRLSELMRRYPMVRKKFYAWLDFYRSVHPRFDERWVLNYRSAMASMKMLLTSLMIGAACA